MSPSMTGEQLQARRKALGLSQRQLALSLNIGVKTIGDWERGKYAIRWPVIRALALDAIETRFERDGLLPTRPSDATQ